MLSSDTTPNKMVVERHHDFLMQMKRETNLDDIAPSVTEMIQMVVCMMGRGFKRKICRKTPPNLFFYKVNIESVKKEKAKYATGNDWVSTNDILCEWLFTGLNRSDGLEMVVNLRNRLPQIETNMAGNYIASCKVNFIDAHNPKDFRARWTDIVDGKRPKDVTATVPNFTTNWATFYRELQIPGLEHHLHLPVLSQEYFWEVWAGIPMTNQSYVVIFHLNAEEVGIAVGTYNDVMTEEFFENSELLAGKVEPAVFYDKVEL